jgi:hypothetical protein
MERVGISNFITFLEKTADYRFPVRTGSLMSSEQEGLEAARIRRRARPKNEGISVATFACHKRAHYRQTYAYRTRWNNQCIDADTHEGMKDPRVPAYESEQIVAAVRKNGQPVWYLLAKDEGQLIYIPQSNFDKATDFPKRRTKTS